MRVDTPLKYSRRQFGATTLMSLVLPPMRATTLDGLSLKRAHIGQGIELHYVESGRGTPVIFVQGSLSDYTYWQGQIEPFARYYRALAYSRRYNFPNQNPARAGYSAIVDADDLARLVRTIRLGKAIVVGHSYGALTALFLAIRHPNLLHAMVLAEAPAVSLLNHLSDHRAAAGKAMFTDIERRMIAPMKAAFAKGDRNAGVGAFIGYVFEDPMAWSKMSQASRDETMRDGHEWDVMMTTGTLFPEIEPASIQQISVPVLLLSGGKSYPFLGLIDERLSQLLPVNRRVTFPDTGHQMWLTHPDICRNAVIAFLKQNGIR